MVVDAHFRLVGFCSFLVYILLCCASYRLCPPDRVELLGGTERGAVAIAAALLLVSMVSIALPLLYRNHRGRRKSLSGVLVGGLIVKFVALTTNATMAFLPTPVMIDPVTGMRVHLLRWCEWTPLAFYMTFMTIGTDVPEKEGPDGIRENLRFAYMHATAQGLSTFCGLLFPFCSNVRIWGFFMVASCFLYLLIFQQIHVRRKHFLALKLGTSIAEKEIYHQTQLALKLHYMCATIWSLLVLSYFFSILAPHFAPPGSVLRDPSIGMVCECFMDVTAKVLYLNVIMDVHSAVFDHGARSERRLQELQKMMSIVWDNSSDAIGISVREVSGVVTTMLSPTYLKMYRGGASVGAGVGVGVGGQSQEYQGRRASLHGTASGTVGCPPPSGGVASLGESLGRLGLVFELDAEEFNRGRSTSGAESNGEILRCSSAAASTSGATVMAAPLLPRRAKANLVFHSNCCEGAQRGDGLGSGADGCRDGSGHQSLSSSIGNGGGTTVTCDTPPAMLREEISSVADLIVRAWDSGRKEALLLHDLVRVQDGTEHVVRCEAKVTKLEDNALVVVMRDISERFRRFEAEKRAISETTARRKDAEANRFTRHEVKNGLLAAIGLCDYLSNAVQREMTVVDKPPAAAMVSSSPPASDDDGYGAYDNGEEGGAGGGTLSLTRHSGEPSGCQPSSLAALAVGESSHVEFLAADREAVMSLALPSPSGGCIGVAVSDTTRCLGELHKTLHEILDTGLAEAMARDVIHEVYEPKLERVDISEALCGLSSLTAFNNPGMERFPLITQPSPLPLFAFDPQVRLLAHQKEEYASVPFFSESSSFFV